MSIVVILGAGPLGSAVARALATRDRVREIVLVDRALGVAEGKALDLQQAGPIEGRGVRLSAAGDIAAAARASVVVVADEAEGGELQGDAGLSTVRRLVRAGICGAMVFAGPNQLELMEHAVLELGVAADRAVATAASGLVGAVRALVAAELDGSGVEIQVSLAGRPAAPVIAWSSATVAGSLVSARVPAHRLLAIGAAIRKGWPPGPETIGSATAGVAEGLAFGSRRHWHAAAMLDGEFGLRRVAALLPLELGQGRILRRVIPTLSPAEQTEVVSGVGSVFHRK